MSALPIHAFHQTLPSIQKNTQQFLQHWKQEEVERIQNVLRVYALGFYQLLRSVRCSVTGDSSSTACCAAIWRLFVFLLHECMPNGAIQHINIAQMEKKQANLYRVGVLSRDSVYDELVEVERLLSRDVLTLDAALRHIQADRQQAEDERMEMTEIIKQQNGNIQAVEIELNELNDQRHRWHERYITSHNRSKMMKEDYIHWNHAQIKLKSQQSELQQSYAVACAMQTDLSTRVTQLTFALRNQHEKMQRLTNRLAEIKQCCARYDSECMTVSFQLICVSTRVGQLVAQALAKIKERVLVSKTVEKIKTKLNHVLSLETSMSNEVSFSTVQKTTLIENISKLKQQQYDFSNAVKSLTSDIGELSHQVEHKKQLIEKEKQHLTELQSLYDQKMALRKKSEKELRLLTTQLDSDEMAIAQAEKRLESAKTAVNALTDIIRTTKLEQKSLMNDVHIVSTHKQELEEEIERYQTNIAQHQQIVTQKIQALKAQIVELENQTVNSGETAKSYQQDTIKFKQAQSDCAQQLMQLEIEMQNISTALNQNQSQENGLQSVAAEARAEADKLQAEFESCSAQRDQLRADLDQLHADHNTRIGQLQTLIEFEQTLAQQQTQHTHAAKQQMAVVGTRRNELEQEHRVNVLKLQAESKQLDTDSTQQSQAHIEFLSNAHQQEQDAIKTIQQLKADLAKAKEKGVSLTTMLLDADSHHQAIRDRVEELRVEVSSLRASNSSASDNVDSLNSGLALAHARVDNPNQSLIDLCDETVSRSQAVWETLNKWQEQKAQRAKRKEVETQVNEEQLQENQDDIKHSQSIGEQNNAESVG